MTSQPGRCACVAVPGLASGSLGQVLNAATLNKGEE